MAPPRILLWPCALLLCLSALAPTANSGGIVAKASAGALDAAVKAQKGKQPSKLPVPAKKSPGAGKKPPGNAKKPPAAGKKVPPGGKKVPPVKKSPAVKQGAKASPPPKGKAKAKAPYPPPAKSKAPVNKKKVPPSPPPPASGSLSTTALRFQRLMGNLEKRGVYSKYLDTVRSTNFADYLETLAGYSLTFFVVPDSIWGTLKTTRTNLRLQLLKYHTSYNMYQKAELDRLPPGAKLVSTNDQMAIYKIAGGKLAGRSTDKDGAYIILPALYYQLDSVNGNWIVHVVSKVLNPASLKF